MYGRWKLLKYKEICMTKYFHTHPYYNATNTEIFLNFAENSSTVSI